MAICRTVVRNLAPRFEQPAEAVREFRRRLLPDLPEDKFITLTYGILDPTERRFTFARAGHDPLLIFHAATGACIEHRPGGGAIGLDRSERFDCKLQEQNIAMQPGDVCVLFTDGITETTNPQGDEFGLPRLSGLIKEQSSLIAAELCSAILDAAAAFARGEAVADDQTLIVLKVS
jgi:sigma-B regulation protein RsbU (phosphoserine phosphatase)